MKFLQSLKRRFESLVLFDALNFIFKNEIVTSIGFQLENCYYMDFLNTYLEQAGLN